jgi:hypothetical protein
MKKLLPIILLLAIAGASAWYFSVSKPTQTASNTTGTSSSTSAPKAGETNKANAPDNLGDKGPAVDDGSANEDADGGDEGIADNNEKPAAQVYKSAEEALKAVKDGATDYDDVVLEQFREPGEDCTWCPVFYQGIRDSMMSPDASKDQRSYYAEILAISGRVENLGVLVDAIKNAGSSDKADDFAQALELAVGKEDVVKFLADQLSSTNQLIKESSVAAITNQGTRLAAETLYNHTVQNGDPDGYYSQGIGLGEFVPDQETLPYVQELAMKRDAYSHLAVKSLLNAGLPGVKIVFDILRNSKDPAGDKLNLLKSAEDHMSYEEETEDFLKKQAETSDQPLIKETAQKFLDAIKGQDTGDDQNSSPIQAVTPAA